MAGVSVADCDTTFDIIDVNDCTSVVMIDVSDRTSVVMIDVDGCGNIVAGNVFDADKGEIIDVKKGVLIGSIEFGDGVVCEVEVMIDGNNE